jgi:hypothetical protein
MELEYSAIWKTVAPLNNGVSGYRVSNGKLTEEDILEAIRRKEDCDEKGIAYVQGLDCCMDSFNIDSVNL